MEGSLDHQLGQRPQIPGDIYEHIWFTSFIQGIRRLTLGRERDFSGHQLEPSPELWIHSQDHYPQHHQTATEPK